MREVFEQYARSVLNGAIAILLLFFLWGGIEFGKIPLLASALDDVERAYGAELQDMDESVGMAEGMQLHRCEGTYGNEIVAGEKTSVEEHLRMTGAFGDLCKVALCKIYRDDVPVSWVLEGDKEYFLFEEPGIYTVYFRFWDTLGSEAYGRVRIPVQRVVP